MAATTDMIQAPKDEALTSAVLGSLVLKGDISCLTDTQKVAYYNQLCARVGLDPATTPFKLLKLNGKEMLYADKGAAEQLRKLHRISVAITSRERIEDVYYVTARATMPDGRSDESQGAVSIARLTGDALANAVMKAETKAKRRVTLSIVGLGMLDESELDTIQPDRFAPITRELAPQQEAPKPAEVVQLPAPKVAAPAAAKQSTNPNKPPKWTSADPLPEMILKPIAALRPLKDIPLAKMPEEDLELVVEAGKKAYEMWSGVSGTSPKALALLKEILTSAAERLLSFRGDAPPPIADDSQAPPDFDPDTGEVRS